MLGSYGGALWDKTNKQLTSIKLSFPMFVVSQCVSWVIYHFYSQTIRFAVWASGKQNSVLNFFPHAVAFTICVQIGFIYRKKSGENHKLVSKVAFKKRNTTEKAKKPFQTFRCSCKFSTETSRKVVRCSIYRFFPTVLL